ncbi:MAG: C40 family peptidase [Ignavibacteriales bacterium]|nr:C40 family peptidase [Ignavibacteriales bacterium]
MISYAKQFLGCPYGRRGTSPRGFDCAGFTQFVFRHFSLDIPRSSSAQAGVGTFVERQDIRKGDILFFKGRNSRSSRIGHVALVISADSGKVNMIHAASNGITVDNLDSLIYYRKRYLGARRVL